MTKQTKLEIRSWRYKKVRIKREFITTESYTDEEASSYDGFGNIIKAIIRTYPAVKQETGLHCSVDDPFDIFEVVMDCFGIDLLKYGDKEVNLCDLPRPTHKIQLKEFGPYLFDAKYFEVLKPIQTTEYVVDETY